MDASLRFDKHSQVTTTIVKIWNSSTIPEVPHAHLQRVLLSLAVSKHWASCDFAFSRMPHKQGVAFLSLTCHLAKFTLLHVLIVYSFYFLKQGQEQRAKYCQQNTLFKKKSFTIDYYFLGKPHHSPFFASLLVFCLLSLIPSLNQFSIFYDNLMIYSKYSDFLFFSTN